MAKAPSKSNATAGSDTISGSSRRDILDGLAGDDTLYGLGGDDDLYGGEGLDKLFGGDGNDVLRGGTNIDDPGADYLDGGAGIDRLNGHAGDDTLIGGAGGDNYWSGKFSGGLYGGYGADYIYGDFVPNPNNPQDPYISQGGDDYINGEVGADHLWGGRGGDLFDFETWGSSTLQTPEFNPRGYVYGVDTIYDFNPGEGDRIGLPGVLTYAGQRTAGALNQFTLTVEETEAGTRTVLNAFVDGDEVPDLTIYIIGNFAVPEGQTPAWVV